MKNISVNISNNPTSYEIIIDNGYIASEIKKYTDMGAFFMVDSKVYSLYPLLFKNIEEKKIFIFKSSERNKNMASVMKMLSFLKNNSAVRKSTVISIGGGILGDTAAFAASLYMRGISVIQVPTTLLSMVDSSVGGKTAVNFDGVKNNIGAFHQPKKVLIDSSFLNTLSKSLFFDGLIEAIKIGIIYDMSFFKFIEDNKQLIKKRDDKIMQEVIASSCKLKASVVEQDEKEAGLRQILNFGHTIAHVIETDSHHKVLHGFAVAKGMAMEMKYGVDNNLLSKGFYDRIIALLKFFGYDLTYQIKNFDLSLSAMLVDKKTEGSGAVIAIPNECGEPYQIVKNINAKALMSYIK